MTRPQQTNAEKIRALPWALSGDATNVIFANLAFAGPVFLLFLDKLGLDKQQIGLVLAIIPFCGLIAMFAAPVTARVGFKRTFLIAMTSRKIVWLLVLATPWVLDRWGNETAFTYIVVVILGFSLCRSVAFGAFGPWVQEFVPDRVRGKFSAAQNVVFVVLAAATLAAAGLFLGDNPQREQFQILIAVGVIVGFVSVAIYSRVPGGGATQGKERQRSDFSSMWSALKDRQFVLFLAGGGLATLGWAPLSMYAFLPLYLKDQVGLEPNQVLYFNAMLLGSGAATCFLCGWAADRYGSKPVLLVSLVILWLYPLGLWLLPADSAMSFPLALTLALVAGLALPGWAVAYSRLLYVKMIPSDQRAGYVAVHQAWTGIMLGMAPLLAGRVLQNTVELDSSLGFLRIDRYTPLMWSGLVLIGLSIVVLSRLASDSGIRVSRFAGMFIQGNALAAMQALIAYRLGGVETKRVSTIERLGQTRSPLNIDELIQGLEDPSFNVRFEAVVSIARTRSDPRLTESLVKVLRSEEPDMCIAAAWALGRVGDRRAIEPLRTALESNYPLLRARSARALGTLGDTASAHTLLVHFSREPDPGIKLAYASALGALGNTEALDTMLQLLDTLGERLQRGELALAIAALCGRDDWFVNLVRRVDSAPGDTMGGVLLSMRKRLLRSTDTHNELSNLIDDAVRAFGHGDLPHGIELLRHIVGLVPNDRFLPTAAKVLGHVCQRLDSGSTNHLDLAMLCLHILHTGYGATATQSESISSGNTHVGN